MSLTPAQIWKILENAPGATIAVYGGHGGTTGTLRILARKGLAVKAALACSPGGANIIDFPALKWLSKQSEPRIWVSDGAVTGHNDSGSYVNQAECFEFCARHRVLRVDHMPQAIKALEHIRLRRAGVISNTRIRKALKTGALEEAY